MSNFKLKASFHTLGCRLNQAETALIANRFRQQGYEVVGFGAASNVCVINSCTVTEQADSKCRQLVRQVLRKNPETFVAVVGCYAQVGADKLRQIEGIDLIVGTQDKLNVVDLIDDPVKQPEPQVVRNPMTREAFTIPASGMPAPTIRANLKIQDGCDFMCSFCLIPFARGRARSRAFWDIQREAQALIAAGHQELVITGVNVGTYQFEDKAFLDVVKMLLAIPGLARLRLSSIEPTTIPEELLELMADSEMLCSHLHIPAQSGSDAVLAGMKRLYTRRDFEAFIELATKRVPDLLIGTDLMIGFPGEDETAFQASCDLLRSSSLAYAHVFTYSERSGTAAVKLHKRVHSKIKKARSARLHQLSSWKKHQFYRAQLGKLARVLTEEQDSGGAWVGFTDNYIKVRIPEPSLSANQLVEVRLVVASGGTIIGELQRNSAFFSSEPSKAFL